MKTSMIFLVTIFSISFSTALNAQSILSYTSESDANGFTQTYTLQEQDVDNLFVVYKEIKKENSAIDATVREVIKTGLIKLFKSNPVATAKKLKTLRLASPATIILINMANEKKVGAEKEKAISGATLALLDEVIKE